MVAVAAIATHLFHVHFTCDLDAAMCVRVLITAFHLVDDVMASVMPLYKLLGVSVGSNIADLCPASAVTYGTLESHARDDLAITAGVSRCRNRLAQECTTFVDEADFERLRSVSVNQLNKSFGDFVDGVNN